MKLKYIFLLLFSLFISIGFSQSWLWAKSFSVSELITPMGMVSDGTYLYTSAIFKGTVNIQGQNYTSGGDYDILIMKHDENGNLQWAKKFGSSGLDFTRSITLEGGNIYISGSIGGSTNFDSYNVSNTDGEDLFIAKISTNGNVNWAKLVAIGPLADRGYDIKVNSSGIYVVGGIDDQLIFFDMLGFPYDTIGVNGKFSTFFARFDNSGNYLNSKCFTSNGERLNLFKIQINAGNVYSAGYYRDSLSFDDTTIVSHGAYDMFAIKTSLDLTTTWFYSDGGLKNEYINGMDIDNSGNMYMVGSFWGDMGTAFGSIVPVGLSDMLIVSLDPSGSLRWVKPSGNAYRQAIYDVYADDKLYITGEFTGQINWGSSVINTPSGDDHHPFIGTMDLNGNFISANSISSSGGITFNTGISIIKNSAGEIFLNGYYNAGTLYFGNNSINKNSSSIRDGFLAKFGCPDNLIFTVKPVSCIDEMGFPVNPDGEITVAANEGGPYIYTWSNGGNTQTISNLTMGTYSVTVSDGGSCTLTGSVTVENLEYIQADIQYINHVSCSTWNDGGAGVTAQFGNPPYNYVWSNGTTGPVATGLAQGTYYVSVSDQCPNQVVLTVVVGLNEIQITGVTTTCTPKKGQCMGTATIYASGGATPYSYIWSNGDTTQTTTGLCLGVYKVTVTDAHGCQKDKDNIHINFCGQGEYPVMSKANVYPNPAKDILQINFPELPEDGTEIKLFDITGKMVIEKVLSAYDSNDYNLNLEGLKDGYYYLLIRGTNVFDNIKISINR